MEEIINSTPREETYAQIVQYLFKPFLVDEWTGEEPDPKDINRIPMLEFRIRGILSQLRIDSYSLQDLISRTLEEFVFTEQVTRSHDTTPEKDEDSSETADEEDLRAKEISHLIDRLHTDPHYRKDRIQDLLAAPYALLLILESAYSQQELSDARIHSSLSVSSLFYGIGIAALSDMAVYYGDELPLSTWLTYWTNHASLVEHRDQLTSPAQKHLAKTAFSMAFLSNDLTYPSIQTIIYESLATLLKENEEDGENR